MQWDGGPSAGFSDGAPWLPLGPDFESRNVASQLEDPASLLNLYRRLIRLRRSQAALQSGSFRTVDGGHKECLCYLREAHETQLLVALNFSSEPILVPLPDPGRVLLWTDSAEHTDETVTVVRLDPFAGMVAVLYS
jgi:alpha-glucosidase